jgi:type IV pilus assembly protein PilM
MFKGKLDFKFDALGRLLRPSSPPLIGVDISSSAVKFVELEDAGRGRYRLERYVIEPLSRDAVVDGNILNLDQVSDAFRRGWKKLNSRVRNVALALPTAAVITKKIAVPAGQREDELELQVETEANQYIPFALDEVNLDFQVLGPSPTNKDDVEVLIAASRKEKVEDRVAAAEAAGLKAVVIDIESHATQAAFELLAQGMPDGGHDQTIAIVDVGTSVMNVNIVRNGESVYLREQPFGGQQLTQEIQRHFGLTAEEAEIAKRTGGLKLLTLSRPVFTIRPADKGLSHASLSFVADLVGAAKTELTLEGPLRVQDGTLVMAPLQVTSKGGSTEAALAHLEAAGLDRMFREALAAADDRARLRGAELAQLAATPN